MKKQKTRNLAVRREVVRFLGSAAAARGRRRVAGGDHGLRLRSAWSWKKMIV
jgi:hypothetical protein